MYLQLIQLLIVCDINLKADICHLCVSVPSEIYLKECKLSQSVPHTLYWYGCHIMFFLCCELSFTSKDQKLFQNSIHNSCIGVVFPHVWSLPRVTFIIVYIYPNDSIQMVLIQCDIMNPDGANLNSIYQIKYMWSPTNTNQHIFAPL